MRAASPETVEALHWRVIASRMWSPGAAETYHSTLTLTKDAKHNAQVAKAKQAAAEIHALLYPEGD